MSVGVIKRDGTTEEFNVEKIHKVISWAVEDIEGVSQSDIELNAKLSIQSGITTTQIHEVLIRSANDLISEESPNYQYVASRLLLYSLRKSVWGGSEPPRLLEHITKLANLGIYDKLVLEKYSESEIHKIGKFVHHKRDDLFTYSGLQQLVDKYLIKNRKTGEIFETPQFSFILIAMSLFSEYPKSTRLDYIKKCYNYISQFRISLSTPIMAGVRTLIRQYSSCVLIDYGDDLHSIFSSTTALGYYSARRAGIGVNIGRIRPIGAPIRNGEVISTGVIPYLKVIEASVKSCSQNGIRGANGTVYIPFWHYEIEDVIVLKNNGGTEDNRVRKLDYNIQFSKIFYQRLIKNEDITLFSSDECEGLYESFGTDKFDELYLKYENKKGLQFCKKVPARQIAELFSRERLETGRIYLMNIDHANQGPWLDTVHTSNLCVSGETLLLTDNGYSEIKYLENQNVNVWNGLEWSNTIVQKTNTNQILYKVTLSDGRSLDCTEYHKWYITKNYSHAARGKITEKRTSELMIGDKLLKFDFPIINGTEERVSPYTHGLFCADGTYTSGHPMIALYGEKQKLIPYLDIRSSSYEETKDCKINVMINRNIEQKYSVPLKSSIKDKLEWLAGYFDGDGCLVIADNSPQIQAVSAEPKFIRDIQLLLDTLGVSSKITPAYDESMRMMPDGKGGQKEYLCRATERLLITSNGLDVLNQLGFKPNRLKVYDYQPTRDARRFVSVVSVEQIDNLHDTFCVKEEKRGMVVFNGILTGNCTEITHPTTPIKHIDDENGEIGVCVLSAINVVETKLEEFESVADIIVRILDEVIDHQDYAVKAAENFTKNRRSLGISLSNFAGLLAKRKIGYEDDQAIELMDELAENLQYYCLKASANLAGEKGKCNKYDRTKYSNKTYSLPIKNAELEKTLKRSPTLDWDSLWKLIDEKGLRHSTLTCQAPIESSSVIQNATNGIEPVRSLLSHKKSKGGILKQLVPNFAKCKNNYTLAFDMKSNSGYLRIASAMQRWIDMSISANAYYNYAHYEGSNIPLSILINDMILMYKLGLRTLYYTNTPDGDSEVGCESGGCTL
jgi:ribonucleoside-diphosphate reductase alpha chain